VFGMVRGKKALLGDKKVSDGGVRTGSQMSGVLRLQSRGGYWPAETQGGNKQSRCVLGGYYEGNRDISSSRGKGGYWLVLSYLWCGKGDEEQK